MEVFQERFGWIFEVFQEGFGSILQFSNRVWGSILGGSGLQFRSILGIWAVLAAKCVLGGVLGGSWVGLGRVLGPKMDQVTPKVFPKQDPRGVLGRREGPLERPMSVLGASLCVLNQLPALHTKK